MAKFEILCVTMHQKDFSKVGEMNIHSDVVFANQADRTEYAEYEFDGHKAKMITTATRGVGINRNIAFAYSKADVCLIGDDDVWYCDDVEKKVVSEFEAHPNADVIIFNLDTDDEARKQKYYNKTQRHPRLGRMPWGGCRIAVRMSSVKKANLWFTTLFGGGCVFPSGEDSMWLLDAKRAGLTFFVSKEIVGRVSFAESSWYSGCDEKFYYGKGAFYQAAHPYTAWARMRFLLLQTRKLGTLSRKDRVRWLKKGRRDYSEHGLLSAKCSCEGCPENQAAAADDECKKSRFEILCVTMHQKDFSKLKEMNVHSNIVYANQADRTEYSECEFDGYKAKMFTTATRGVGVNRNLAFTHAGAEICLLADDDVRYHDDMEERVLREFDAHPDADIIVFHLETDDKRRSQRKYERTRKCGRFERQPWGAFRIAFRLSSIKKANVWFTTLYGGGCIFPAGEDSMWLIDAKRAGLTFYVSKETIGEVSFETSSWYTGYDEKYFFSRGSWYACIHPHTQCIWRLYAAFTVRKHCSLSFGEKMRWMRTGALGFREMRGYGEFKQDTNQG